MALCGRCGWTNCTCLLFRGLPKLLIGKELEPLPIVSQKQDSKPKTSGRPKRHYRGTAGPAYRTGAELARIKSS